MYAILNDPLELLEPNTLGVEGLPRLRRASAELLSAISEATRLRHARYCGVASAIGEIAVRALAPLARGTGRAMLTAGIDPHQAVAENFGMRLREAGPRRLNPIMFPHTLPSAAAVTLGAQFEAHTCAIALDGRAAVQDALSLAQLLLATNQVTDVLLFVCIAMAGFERPDPSRELSGIGVLLGAQPFAVNCLRVVPDFETSLSGRTQSSSIEEDLRVLTMLANRTKSEPPEANPAIAGGHRFYVNC